MFHALSRLNIPPIILWSQTTS